MNMNTSNAQYVTCHFYFLDGYGQKSNELNQRRGAITARQGRCIAFPNTMQHCMSPFELADPTRPGHRDILVFFLVDPNVRVLSTARVPPQQKDWFKQELRYSAKPLRQLPKTAFDRIIDYLEFPLSHAEALQHREDLMSERGRFVTSQNSNVYERSFSLCEH
jgi:hypothetical protein